MASGQPLALVAMRVGADAFWTYCRAAQPRSSSLLLRGPTFRREAEGTLATDVHQRPIDVVIAVQELRKRVVSLQAI
jgi:hypothetical protein